MKIKEALIDILNEHKNNVLELIDEDKDGPFVTDDSLLTKEFKEVFDGMITEVKELLGSSYEN